VDLARRAVTIFTDTGCDLPDDVVRAHGIHLVPLTLIVGGEVYRDRIDMGPEEFVRRLKQGARGSTSQPAPASFLEAYERAAVDGEQVLGVLLGSTLSGTLASAQAAARRFDAAPVRLVDSLGASLLQGLLTLKAAELAESGMGAEDIATEVARIRGRSGLMFTVDIYDYLLASGRVGKGRVWLANLLDLKPVLGLDAAGAIQPLAKVRGRTNVLGRMLELLSARIPQDACGLRFGVIHVAAPEILEPASAALRERFGPHEIMCAPATPVIALHVGPGAWGIAWMLED
jgi:DegV family protein with EDD domain